MTDDDTPDLDDLWESHAGWWQAGFTDGADAEYEEQILPMAAEHLQGARTVLDVGTGEGQIARLALQRAGAATVVGIDPTWAQIHAAAERAQGPAYARAAAARLPFPTHTFDDRILDEQYWRIGLYLHEDKTVEEVEKGVFIPFIHRPLSRYVNALADNGLLIVRMDEPAPPPGFLARAAEYEQAAAVPRLLFVRAHKSG